MPRGSEQFLTGEGGEGGQEGRGGRGGNRNGCPSESSADPVDLTAALTDKLKTQGLASFVFGVVLNSVGSC